MRRLAFIALFIATPAFAQTPLSVTLPPEVPGKSNSFILVPAETQGKTVVWVPLDLDKDGKPVVSLIPSNLLQSTKTAVAMAPPGRWRLLAYTAIGDVPSPPAITVLVVDGGKPPPTPDDPPDPPPVDPPDQPTALYFVIVRADGPSAPSFTQIMSLPAWQELRSKGCYVKDYTLSEARARGVSLAEGATLPYVVTYRVSSDFKKSTLAREAVAMPTTADAILALPNGIKQ